MSLTYTDHRGQPVTCGDSALIITVAFKPPHILIGTSSSKQDMRVRGYSKPGTDLRTVREGLGGRALTGHRTVQFVRAGDSTVPSRAVRVTGYRGSQRVSIQDAETAV